MDIRIVKATPADGAALLAFLKQVGGESDNLTFGSEGVPFTVEDEENYLSGIEKASHSCMLLAKCGDRIVGNVAVNGSPNERLRHKGELAISVVKEAWGQGVGTRLMEQAILFARGAGMTVLHLAVRTDNRRAIGLYKKCGFEKIGHFPGMMIIDGQRIDYDLMNLYL